MSKKEDFHDRLSRFIAFLGLKPTSFEVEMGFSNGSISKAINEKRAVGSDRLETIVSKYPALNITWLLTGVGEMTRTYPSMPDDTSVVVRESYVVDKSSNMLIPIAEISAAAGTGYMNTEVLRTSEFVQLPPALVKSGKYLCVRIKGHSMSPTLQDGGYVVIRLLERGEWGALISDRVYVVGDTEGKVYLKRLRNRLANGFIVLTSDNPDKATFPNFNLQESDILSIWYVEWYLSAKLPNVHSTYEARIDRLEETLDVISRRFDELERMELKQVNPKQK